MDILAIVEKIGEAPTAALLGVITGIIFGISAQRSRFCLRAATVEFARGQLGDKVAVWFLTISTAIVWVQAAQLLGLFNAADARQMAIPGSWSGAIIGGLLFGVGMVLARGCSGRLLVLAATGNLRSVVSGLIFAVVAQMSLSGILSEFRNSIASMWVTTGGRNLDLIAFIGLPEWGGLAIGLLFAVLALVLSWRNQITVSRLFSDEGDGAGGGQPAEQARAEIGQEVRRAKAELRDETVTLSLTTAERLLQRNLTEEDHRRLAEQYIEELGRTS